MRLLAAALAVAGLFFVGLGRPPLLEPDEGRYTEIPREMLATGDFISPHLNGVLYFEKPPLYYWLNAAAIALFGLNEFSARFWSAACGVLGIWLTFALGRAMSGAAVGAMAAACLASMPLYLACSRLALIDITLALLIELTLACCWFAWNAPMQSGAARRWWLGGAAAAGAAVMTKGLIGIVIPGVIVAVFVAVVREWRKLARIPWVVATVVFLGVTLPWHVLVAIRHREFLHFYFIREHFQRYLTPIAEREQPIYFFLLVLAVGLLPWSGAIVTAIHRLWKDRSDLDSRSRQAARFLVAWAVVPIVFFSLSKSKLIPYILPSLPPLSLLLALGLGRVWSARRGGLGGGLRFGIAAAALLSTAAGFASFGWFGQRPEVDGGMRWVVLLASVVLWLLAIGYRRLAVDPTRAAATSALAGVVLCASLVPVAASVARGKLASRTIVERFGEAFARADAVFAYGYYPQAIPVYLKRRIGVSSFLGETEFGVSLLPDAERRQRFPNDAEFCDILDRIRGPIVVIAEAKALPPACGRLATAGRHRIGGFVLLQAAAAEARASGGVRGTVSAGADP